ncbi:MAG: prepilin-type N-terminal cleavage/methylation domain-containing protein [Nitrospirae bacterium]|nr:prepilin-type N-terminal cleavage/methylation domain-containing protein [Magnetococcales bacterium]HAT49644.1 hypothetical protein [Alphaproteobacteria bacterium]
MTHCADDMLGDDWMGKRSKLKRYRRTAVQRGISLIEVMMGIVLLSLFVIGVAEFWAVFKGQLVQNTIRQQAVFVLHGQMERIVAIYRQPDESYQIYGLTTDYNADHPDTSHSILVDSPNGLVTSDRNDFAQGVIFFQDTGIFGPSSKDRNVVWIDQEHGVAGYLSWVLAGIGQANCYPGVYCQELKIYLDYPYWVEKNDMILQLRPSPDGIDTLRIDTLVGQWS